MIVLAVAVIFWIISVPFFFNAWAAYPHSDTKPVKGTFTPLVLPVTNSSSSVETFVIAPPNHTIVGYMPTNTITHSVSGSSMTSQTPLNITVTLDINPIYPAIGYFIDPNFVMIDNSVLLVGTNPKVPFTVPSPPLDFQLISNSSQYGLVYSTSYVPFNNTFFPKLVDTISLNNAGYLTGTVFMLIGSKANPNSSAWFQGFELQVRNETSINVESYQNLLLQEQNIQVANENLQNNVETVYDNALNLYNESILNSLEWLIAAFILADLGFATLELRH